MRANSNPILPKLELGRLRNQCYVHRRTHRHHGQTPLHFQLPRIRDALASRINVADGQLKKLIMQFALLCEKIVMYLDRVL